MYKYGRVIDYTGDGAVAEILVDGQPTGETVTFGFTRRVVIRPVGSEQPEFGEPHKDKLLPIIDGLVILRNNAGTAEWAYASDWRRAVHSGS